MTPAFDNRCRYDVDNSPHDNRCLRNTYAFGFCSQHFEIIKKLLDEIKGEKVTWNQPGRKTRTFRLWTSELDYRTVSRQVAWMVHQDFVNCFMAAGYQHVTRGYCELTALGRSTQRAMAEFVACGG